MDINIKICYYLKECDVLARGNYIPPITCEIDPSNACMLNCSFCIYANHLSKHHENMDFRVFVKLVQDLAEIGVESITFTGGGEPLMNRHFWPMAVYAKSLGFEIGLITNGVLLHKKVFNPEIFSFIRVSLDSWDRESYKRIKGADFFDQVIENSKRVAPKTDFGFSYVVHDGNREGIERAEKVATTVGVDYIQFKPVCINGQIDPMDLQLTSKKSIITNRYQIKDNLPCKLAGLIGVVGADSKAYFCCQSRGIEKLSIGNVSREPFSELWKKRMELSPDISKCAVCRYSGYAKSYIEFSDKKYSFLRHKKFL